MEIGRGVYDTRRAAALAGVPVSTLHYWARTGLITPSVCPEPHVRLWSWADLLALRAIDFFRKAKGKGEPNRDLFLLAGGDAIRADHSAQAALPGVLALVRPYGRGPDLLEPRPRLRIIPGKLHGEPHLPNTRIPSAAVYALHEAGYASVVIRRIYPEASPESIADAIELERSLTDRAA